MLKNTLRKHLEQVYPDKELSCWFTPLDIRVDQENNLVRVSFPHALFGQWFMNSIRQGFETQALPFIHPMSFAYNCPLCAVGISQKTESSRTAKPLSYSSASSFMAPPKRYTFSSFLVNKKNDFPLAAAKEAVPAADSPVYTPFVVYGQSGSGKTHLLGAMANAIMEEKPALSVYYGDIDILGLIEAESALSGRAIIIDNAQRICSSPSLQEELIHILDRSSVSNSFIILAFDAHPANCPDISQKLVTRLSSGLVVELKKPDIDIRRQYTHKKTESLGVIISKEQELTLAQRYHDFRSIDGVLTRIAAYRSTIRHDEDLRVILDKDEEQKVLTPAVIISATANYFSIAPDALTGKSRDKSIIIPRQTAMFLIRELLAVPLAQIGEEFGGRDHSSIVYAIKKIKEIKDSNKDINKYLTELKQLCLSGRS